MGAQTHDDKLLICQVGGWRRGWQSSQLSIKTSCQNPGQSQLYVIRTHLGDTYAENTQKKQPPLHVNKWDCTKTAAKTTALKMTPALDWIFWRIYTYPWFDSLHFGQSGLEQTTYFNAISTGTVPSQGSRYHVYGTRCTKVWHFVI